MMATDTSIKNDGLCSLTAQKLSEEQQVFAGGPPGIYTLHMKFESLENRCGAKSSDIKIQRNMRLIMNRKNAF